MKTYSAKTNALAADAVLTAAVEEAARILRRAPLDDRGPAYIVGRVIYRYPNDAGVRAERVLLSAARSAELLLERAR